MEARSGLSGKRILLCVTGSIAAYKAIDVLRRLKEQGVEVRVAMTKNAAHFVSPMTFEALSGLPVLCDEFHSAGRRGPIGHIEITDNLDLAVVAPASANIIGKIASGIADDSVTTALMAIDCPFLIAPAMNERMYRNPILQKNIQSLVQQGVRFVEPGTGSLACGTSGQGRLADTDLIITAIHAACGPVDLNGKTVLVTAGPTREAIDAVRFISNPSTGKMGYAVAEAARARGADVILVTGPTALTHPSGITVVPVVSAEEMRTTVMAHLSQCHVVIMAAAVSDFKPLQASDRKIKKEEVPSIVQFERTRDILQEIGTMAGKRIVVGFAAETDNVEQNALRKLADKNLDMIVVNDLLKPGSGFGTDTNAVVIFERSGKRTELPTMQKSTIAARILDAVVEHLKNKNA